MSGSRFDTHDVFNQPPPFPVVNALESDPVLIGALDHTLDASAEKALMAHGAFWGSFEARELARLALKSPPTLLIHDASGRRIDTIEHHPAYHALMRRSAEAGLGAPPAKGQGAPPHAESHRAARLFLTAQTEPGHLAAFTASHAAGGVLDLAGGDAAQAWIDGLATGRYDHRPLPLEQKAGVTISVGLTEKQGGVEPLDSTTAATPSAAGYHRLIGHKWFLSAPASDAAIILAEAPGGPSAFLVPRFRTDGSANPMRFVRLKDTFGMRVTATAEIDLADADGYLLGGEGDGPTLIGEALSRLRLDATVIAAGQMRAALAHAVHHCRHRAVSGERLVDLDLMTRVLADMALDVAGATVLAMRLAQARDLAATDQQEAAYFRVVLPAAKYWIAKTGVAVAAEAMECVGGNGYVELGGMPKFLRDAPANVLWAGPGNVLALDLIDVLAADPTALDAPLAEFTTELGRGGAVSTEVIRAAATACQEDRGSARILAEQLALAAAAAALHRYSPRAITDAFLDTRLSGPWRATYGMLDGRYDARGIVDYAFHGL
ncbi:MAG: acyl-CoA dehydrogenase family protein [Ancalomicrobiaceae bacterium]|nr:acyl-CoA dehydrogenase family protein [Ancalomicrobiaceae bacterium]